VGNLAPARGATTFFYNAWILVEMVILGLDYLPCR
jgi:hypothetical protein